MEKLFNKKLLVISVIFFLCFVFSPPSSGQDVALKIKVRGVYETGISVIPLAGYNALSPLLSKESIKNGETASFKIPANELPGEFVIRYDYKEQFSSTPYPSEQFIIIHKQDIELDINPPYCNDKDSVFFKQGEKENSVFLKFKNENKDKKGKVEVLYSFLMGYDEINSPLYQQAVEAYEKRRETYNQWLKEQINLNKELFASHIFVLEYIPQILFKGSDNERLQSIITHYFDGIDFNDSLLVKVSEFKEWMNTYVNFYGGLAKTEALRDSLFTLAGKRAVELASKGHPEVYGWMVDYFYNGYESFNLSKGMLMLKEHIDNPRCLTSKKQQIKKRLEGMARLTEGTLAPDFMLTDAQGKGFTFHTFKGTTKYKLLLFWSADCEHCKELVIGLKKWYDEAENQKKLSIVAVSLDDTEDEVKVWAQTITQLKGWLHMRAPGGVNSNVANDYALLSTPVMFIVESSSNIIKGTPDSLEKLIKAINLLYSGQ